MPQNDNATKLAGAKAGLAHANVKFPSSMAPKPPAAPAKPVPAPQPASNLGTEITAKSRNVDEYNRANPNAPLIPRMHSGGPVMADGPYQLKAGEHVLTAPEAEMARKHALMASGMKSLVKTAPKTAGEPAAKKMGSKKTTTGVTVRPEKNQAAKIADKTKK